MAASFCFGSNFIAVKSGAPGSCGHVIFLGRRKIPMPLPSDGGARNSEVGQACQGTFVTSADNIRNFPEFLCTS